LHLGPIRSGDSLRTIADPIATEAGFSCDQVMLALLEANPDAFSPACNDNGVMRIGAVLRVPSAERIGAGHMAPIFPGLLGTPIGPSLGCPCRWPGGWCSAG
jgi:FimV-like protein